jgi:Zn finger protein HypA/HybF involved in hydrogenase expression
MKLTRKQAFELSIKKWEAWAMGNETPYEIMKLNLTCECGLCEKYIRTSYNNIWFCAKCPIRPKIKDYDRNSAISTGCNQSIHPFSNWRKNKTTENAQKVLDLIKSKQ